MGNTLASGEPAAFTPSDAWFLSSACQTGNLDIVRVFLRKNPALVYATTASGDRSTPWHFASAGGHEHVLRVLVETLRSNSVSNTFDPLVKVINQQNTKGQTPLMLACAGGHSACVQLLLTAGAHLLVADQGGLSALHWAALHYRPDGRGNDCAELLLAYMQQQLLAQGPEVAPPAVHAGVIRKFADAGDLYGRTALHYAAWSGNARAAHSLWLVGADICARTAVDCYDSDLPCNTGTTPLHFAAMRGHQPVVVLLLAAWHRLMRHPATPLPRPAFMEQAIREQLLKTQSEREQAHALSMQQAEQLRQQQAPQQQELQGPDSSKADEPGGEGGSPQASDEQPERSRAEGNVEGEGKGVVFEATSVANEAAGAPASQRENAPEEAGPPSSRSDGASGIANAPASGGASASEILPSGDGQSRPVSAAATNSGGGHDAATAQGVTTELPPLLQPPRTPPNDPRLMVDAYGMTPYSIACKRKLERTMLIELLDPSTDFGGGDSDSDDSDAGSGGGGADGEIHEGLNGGIEARGLLRGRRSSFAAAMGRGDSDSDDADSMVGGGPLLLWEGVELIQGLAEDPSVYAKLAASTPLLQPQHPEEEDDAGPRGGGRQGDIAARAGRRASAISAVGGSVGMSAADDPVPDCFLCPLTCQVLRDPVVAADGATYEREAIERHLRFASTSPTTKQRMSSTQLYPNNALKSAIELWGAMATAGGDHGSWASGGVGGGGGGHAAGPAAWRRCSSMGTGLLGRR